MTIELRIQTFAEFDGRDDDRGDFDFEMVAFDCFFESAKEAVEHFVARAQEAGTGFAAMVAVRKRDVERECIASQFIEALKDQGPDGVGAQCPSGSATVVVCDSETERLSDTPGEAFFKQCAQEHAAYAIWSTERPGRR